MVKLHVTALVGQLGGPLLDGVVQNLVHPGDVGAGADDSSQILQGPLKRIVQPGHHQQEQEKRQKVQASLD